MGSEPLHHRSSQFSAADQKCLGFCFSFALRHLRRLNPTRGRHTSELSPQWICEGIMGLLLPEPLGVAFSLALFLLLHMTAVMTVRQMASNPRAAPPPTVSRLSSELALLSSRGRTPSGGTRP